MRKIRFGPRSFVKLVYPDGLCCCLCGDELFDDKDFCAECEPPVLSHVCRVCGRALPDESGREYCDGCLNGQRGLLFNAARAPYSYADERVKHLIWNLKYNDATYLAEVLAKPMVEVLRKQDWEVDVNSVCEHTIRRNFWRVKSDGSRGFRWKRCCPNWSIPKSLRPNSGEPIE